MARPDACWEAPAACTLFKRNPHETRNDQDHHPRRPQAAGACACSCIDLHFSRAGADRRGATGAEIGASSRSSSPNSRRILARPGRPQRRLRSSSRRRAGSLPDCGRPGHWQSRMGRTWPGVWSDQQDGWLRQYPSADEGRRASSSIGRQQVRGRWSQRLPPASSR